MPWHPLLPPNDFEEVSRRRIRFLRLFAERASQLLAASRCCEKEAEPLAEPLKETIGLLPPTPDAGLMAAMAALTEAAELSFLSNCTSEGVRLVRDVVNRLVAQPDELWPTTRIALLGAITRQVKTKLLLRGIVLAAEERIRTTSWSTDAGIADQTSGALVAAVLASGNAARGLELIGPPSSTIGDETVLGFVAMIKAPEVDVLPLFELARDEDGRIRDMSTSDLYQLELGWIAAVARVQNYAARVRTLRTDPIRWRHLRPRVPLLDWSLLALFLGFRRLGGSGMLDDLVRRCGPSGLVATLAAYLRDLANEIDNELGREVRAPLPSGPSLSYAAPPTYQEMSQSGGSRWREY